MRKKYSEEYYALKERLKWIKQRDENVKYIEMFKANVVQAERYLAKQKRNTKEFFLAEQELKYQKEVLGWSLNDYKKAKLALRRQPAVKL